MFVGYAQNKCHPVVFSMLSNEVIRFHLTGSRFFGTARPESDWDFFTDYSVRTILFLRELGFSTLTESSSSYNDQETRMVMRFLDGKIQIDVQLVNNSAKKVRINNAIKHRPDFLRLMNSLKKSERAAFWDLLLFASGSEWFDRQLLNKEFDNSAERKELKDLIGVV